MLNTSLPGLFKLCLAHRFCHLLTIYVIYMYICMYMLVYIQMPTFACAYTCFSHEGSLWERAETAATGVFFALVLLRE
jgi:hypothetical protein